MNHSAEIHQLILGPLVELFEKGATDGKAVDLFVWIAVGLNRREVKVADTTCRRYCFPDDTLVFRHHVLLRVRFVDDVLRDTTSFFW